jgi:hypothetical protein
MVIAFYPGGGGNRFYQWLQGQTRFESNTGYDRANPFQSFINRYPTPETKSQLISHPVIFTHCVNHDLITEYWPDHKEIFFVSTDPVKSLRRQWNLFQKFKSSNQHPVDGPFSTIAWHDEYYTQGPWNPGPGTVVDHDSFSEFSIMIQKELDSIVCPEFDFAQQMFDRHGPQAPILDLYNQYYDHK